MADAGSDPLIGQVLNDRFLIESLLGEGAMGRVYRGLQVDLRRPVAIKVMHPQFAVREDMRQRFLREARAASMLAHPNSVVVHDFGSFGEYLYLAMELLDGPTLGAVIEREHPLALERLVGLLTSLLDVLEVAHSSELLHRDLKPDNLVLLTTHDGGERLKVVDFGLAYVMDPESDSRLTRDGSVSGTPTYMAPEQVRGEELDGRADLYAVGCMLYELLVGHPPFVADSAMEVMLKQLYEEPAPLTRRSQSGGAEQALEAVAIRAMAKPRDARYPTAQAMRDALRAAMAPPSPEAGATHGGVQPLDRARRADAVGLRPHPKAWTPGPGDGALAELELLVVRSREVPFGESAVLPLRAGGATVEAVEDMARITDPDVDAIVVDLRPASDDRLREVASVLGSGSVPTRPWLVVGPASSFEAMSKTLELGASDYIPDTEVARLPEKVARAVRRFARRTRQGPRA